MISLVSHLTRVCLFLSSRLLGVTTMRVEVHNCGGRVGGRVLARPVDDRLRLLVLPVATMRGGPAQLDLSSRRSSPGGESLSATKPYIGMSIEERRNDFRAARDSYSCWL